MIRCNDNLFQLLINERRTAQEKITLTLSFVGGFGIFPFAVYRLLIHDWTMAAADLAVSLSMSWLFFYVLTTRKVDLASKFLAGLALTSIVTTINLKGITEMYWAYPAMVSVLFLLKPKMGLTLALMTIALIFPILYQTGSPLVVATVLITLLTTLCFAYIFTSEMDFQQKQLIRLATKDPLTGAGNRRALAKKMRQVVSSFQRTGSSKSLLLIDMDHFKAVNDTFGHNAGDRFLVEVTKRLQSRIRNSDEIYRFGGEEFIVITEDTEQEKAKILAEELRLIVEMGDIIPETAVTVSIGIAQLRKNETDEQWIKRADRALFDAKETGRNKVCLAEI